MKINKLELLLFFNDKFSSLINAATYSKHAWQELEDPADTNFTGEGSLCMEIYCRCITPWLRSQHGLDGSSL